ncbi:MAG: hypothetical protein LQ352_005170 [Teloschistes flavicans]|nr:MAG: hypothetical protein LQ352_005170 [Teloschistes flavicans]
MPFDERSTTPTTPAPIDIPPSTSIPRLKNAELLRLDSDTFVSSPVSAPATRVFDNGDFDSARGSPTICDKQEGMTAWDAWMNAYYSPDSADSPYEHARSIFNPAWQLHWPSDDDAMFSSSATPTAFAGSQFETPCSPFDHLAWHYDNRASSSVAATISPTSPIHHPSDLSHGLGWRKVDEEHPRGIHTSNFPSLLQGNDNIQGLPSSAPPTFPSHLSSYHAYRPTSTTTTAEYTENPSSEPTSAFKPDFDSPFPSPAPPASSPVYPSEYLTGEAVCFEPLDDALIDAYLASLSKEHFEDGPVVLGAVERENMDAGEMDGDAGEHEEGSVEVIDGIA